MEIIPAILVQDFRELKRKIKLVEPYTQWVQIDVVDGKFAPRVSWSEPKKLKKIETKLKFEIQLMVINPWRAVDEWLKAGAQRIIVHWEGLKLNPEEEFQAILEKAKKFKVEIGIGLNPETAWQEIEGLIPQLETVLFLSVRPGFGSQVFLESVLAKIKSLHQKYPEVIIEVDGGINPETGRKCLEAGASILIAGSYLFKSQDIAKAIAELKRPFQNV